MSKFSIIDNKSPYIRHEDWIWAVKQGEEIVLRVSGPHALAACYAFIKQSESELDVNIMQEVQKYMPERFIVKEYYIKGDKKLARDINIFDTREAADEHIKKVNAENDECVAAMKKRYSSLTDDKIANYIAEYSGTTHEL